MPGLATVAATRYVLPLREGGSLPALVEADDDGLYVVKLRGSGQGLATLVAELFVGELGRVLGLCVPELRIVALDPELASAEPDPEIQELLEASAGLNVGLDFLPGSLPYAAATAEVSPELAADVVWLDTLTLNVDRTPRNPNLLIWHDRLWLIDHGAALYPHHSDSWPDGAAQTVMPHVGEHVLLPRAGSILDAHERLAPQLDPGALEAVALALPEDWLADTGHSRESYTDFIAARIASGEFARLAEQARSEVQGD